MADGNTEASKPIVPKFSSFRPKANPIPERKRSPRRSTGTSSPSGIEKPRNPERRHHEKASKLKGRDEAAHSSTVYENDELPDYHEHDHAIISATTPASQTKRDGDQVFFYDGRGDPKNLVYGGLSKYNVPAYRRAGYGEILGPNVRGGTNRLLVDEETDRNRPAPGKGRPLITKAVDERQEVRLLVPSEQSDFEHTLDYLDLNPTTKAGRSSSSCSSSDAEHSTQDYRSLDRPSTQNIAPEPHHGHEKLLAADVAVQEKNAKLIRLTKTDPQNVEAWLDLIEHQQAMIRLGQSRIRTELSNNEKHSLADVRLSIYEQALREVRDSNTSRIRLILNMMREAAKIWDSKRVLSKWKEILSDQPDCAELWTEYLDVVQTSFTGFTYEKTRRLFQECLELLARPEPWNKPKSSQNRRRQEIQAYVFLRLSALMRESGYIEHAIALWQGLLELYFFRPEGVTGEAGMTRDMAEQAALMSGLGDFWESEVPRIGEPDASGWRQYHVHGGRAPKPKRQYLSPVAEDERSLEQFGELEIIHMKALRLPGRTSDYVEEDDPYHVILFADIADYIRLLPACLDRFVAIDAFLNFAGMPPLHHSQASDVQHFWLDPFLRSESSRGYSDNESQPALSHVRTTTQTLFGNVFGSCELAVDLTWVRATLECLLTVMVDHDTFCEYYLAFIAHFFPSEARKVAKTLLKTRPSSLRLYNAYGLIEYRAGNAKVADHVIASAVGLVKKLPHQHQSDAIFLWRSWIWEALLAENFAAAWHRALHVGDPDSLGEVVSETDAGATNPALLLNARQRLTEGRAQMLALARYEHAILFTECLAFLAYLQSSRDISVALEPFHQLSSLLTVRGMINSPENEMNHQARSQLLDYHMSHTRLFKPAMARQELSESISLFPNNTMFLTAYAANEIRFRIDDRVRTLVRDVVVKENRDTVIGWAFAIWQERRRGSDMGATSHSVRATYERAVESQSGKHSAFIWTSYFLYEHALGDLPSAKAVFFRGLTCLPWVKRYMMLAFTHLRDFLSRDDLRRVYNVMMEKELRIHIDLQDAFEDS